jgi:hypothetical protein
MEKFASLDIESEILNQKPRPAFGYVIMENNVKLNEKYYTEIKSDSCCILYYVKGIINFKKNDKIIKANPGKLIDSSKEDIGFYESTVEKEDAKFFCLDKRMNKDFFPTIKKYELKIGNKTTIKNNSKFYFCYGKLEIDGQEIIAPRQLHFKNGDKEIKAITDIYGLFFL